MDSVNEIGYASVTDTIRKIIEVLVKEGIDGEGACAVLEAAKNAVRATQWSGSLSGTWEIPSG